MNTIFFDLDGTLLPMDLDEFIQKYFGYIVETMYKNGRDGKMILNAILKGVESIIRNDGTMTNEQKFWQTFTAITNIPQEDIEPEFNKFYEEVFDKIDTGAQSKNMIEAVKVLKQKGYTLYLTTSPLFPAIATQKRMKWAGLDKEDFELVTTYENSSYCKPNPAYYQEVITKYNLDPKNILMVGNDVKEDGAIQQLGVDLYLVDDFLLNKYNLEITCKYRSNSEQFLNFVKQLPESK